MSTGGPPLTNERIMAALAQVIDPDRRRDIVSLGMVSGLNVKDGHVGFTLEVDPERGPQLEPLRKAAEQAVDRLPGVLTVTAVMTAEKPGAPAGRPAQGHAHGHAHGHGHAQGAPAAQKPLSRRKRKNSTRPCGGDRGAQAVCRCKAWGGAAFLRWGR